MKVVPRFFALRLVACLLFMGSCLELFKGDQKMRTYQVKQKFRLGGERFDIKDELGNVEYQVEGSFLKIPKTFTIYDKNGQEVSHITKKPISLLPKFVVELKDGDSFFIHKKLTLFRDRYYSQDSGLRGQGTIWDLEFN